MHTESANNTPTLPFSSSTTEQSRQKRVDFLRHLGPLLSTYAETSLDNETVKSNIESYLGTMTIPVGLVGPLSFKNHDQIEQTFCPAATTEGALVASMNRGAKVISLCGGFSAHVNKQRMLRAPLFCLENLEQSIQFEAWVQKHFSLLSVYIKQFSTRAELLEIKSTIIGRNVELKFYYQTADAAGQNMTTICTWQACLWIEREFNQQSAFKIQDFVLEGNGASDKKASYDTILNGRGVDVVGECILDEEVLNKKLKVTSHDILKFYQKSRSIITANGMMGDNINIANTIAAIFTACGQDIACVHESSIGYLNFEPHPRGLYVTLRLPKLVIGTVGGGTSLPSQKENLEIMKCYGPGKLERFAKLICGFAMSLEISTISAMVSGQFAIAHEKLGRNKPVQFLKENKALPSFIAKNVLKCEESYLELKDKFNQSNGIITEITSQNATKLLGLSLWSIQKGDQSEIALLKSKPISRETLNCMYILTGMLAPSLAREFQKIQDKTDFNFGDEKELLVYEQLKETSASIPKIYGTYYDANREISLVLMKYLSAKKLHIFNSELTPELWNKNDLIDLFNLQAKNLKALSVLNAHEKFQNNYPLINGFSTQALEILKDEYAEELTAFYPLYLRALSRAKSCDNTNHFKTVVHNDFNPRNIAKGESFYIYDWELARVNLPQRDYIEFLAFVFENYDIQEHFEEILKNANEAINQHFEIEITDKQWREGALIALDDFILSRLSLYLLGNKLAKYEFVEAVVKNCLEIEKRLLV